MFDKPDNMRISKSAGSPAFMPPELCGKHKDVSGKAADIWSMGVTLYCLKYGKIPFSRSGVLEIYEAIKTDDPPIPENEDPAFADLMGKILEKDPEKRIAMPELRVSRGHDHGLPFCVANPRLLFRNIPGSPREGSTRCCPRKTIAQTWLSLPMSSS